MLSTKTIQEIFSKNWRQ